MITRAMQMTGIGAHKRRENDFYRTPGWVIEALLARKEFEGSGVMWEPACGDGAICKIYKRRCPHVKMIATDLIDRGYGDGGIDFLKSDFQPGSVDDIITNPPFSLATEFAIKALSIAQNKIALLLTLNFLASERRYPFFAANPHFRVYVFSQRIDFSGRKRHGGMKDHAWFVWNQKTAQEDPWASPGIGWILDDAIRKGLRRCSLGCFDMRRC